MGVLGAAPTCIAAAGLALGFPLGGCYSPSLRDCTVSCGSANDCATGQVCGPDGMCASPEIAGRCARVDAGPPDAALPDATRTVRLTVQIMGKGSVAVEGIDTCSSGDADHGSCAYDVATGVPLTAQAMPITATDVFTMWSSMTCAGQSARCLFTPLAATVIAARFGHSDMHGAP